MFAQCPVHVLVPIVCRSPPTKGICNLAFSCAVADLKKGLISKKKVTKFLVETFSELEICPKSSGAFGLHSEVQSASKCASEGWTTLTKDCQVWRRQDLPVVRQVEILADSWWTWLK